MEWKYKEDIPQSRIPGAKEIDHMWVTLSLFGKLKSFGFLQFGAGFYSNHCPMFEYFHSDLNYDNGSKRQRQNLVSTHPIKNPKYKEI